MTLHDQTIQGMNIYLLSFNTDSSVLAYSYSTAVLVSSNLGSIWYKPWLGMMPFMLHCVFYCILSMYFTVCFHVFDCILSCILLYTFMCFTVYFHVFDCMLSCILLYTFNVFYCILSMYFTVYFHVMLCILLYTVSFSLTLTWAKVWLSGLEHV